MSPSPARVLVRRACEEIALAWRWGRRRGARIQKEGEVRPRSIPERQRRGPPGGLSTAYDRNLSEPAVDCQIAICTHFAK